MCAFLFFCFRHECWKKERQLPGSTPLRWTISKQFIHNCQKNRIEWVCWQIHAFHILQLSLTKISFFFLVKQNKLEITRLNAALLAKTEEASALASEKRALEFRVQEMLKNDGKIYALRRVTFFYFLRKGKGKGTWKLILMHFFGGAETLRHSGQIFTTSAAASKRSYQASSSFARAGQHYCPIAAYVGRCKGQPGETMNFLLVVLLLL